MNVGDREKLREAGRLWREARSEKAREHARRARDRAMIAESPHAGLPVFAGMSVFGVMPAGFLAHLPAILSRLPSEVTRTSPPAHPIPPATNGTGGAL